MAYRVKFAQKLKEQKRKPIMIDNASPTTSKKTPPKVPSQPPVGVVPQLVEKQLDFLLDAQAQYGDIFTIDLAGTEVLVLGHPRHAQHVLVKNARNYRSKGGLTAFRTMSYLLMKNGLATIDTAEGLWKQQRRAIQPHFHRKYMTQLTELMVETIEETLSLWDSPEFLTGPVDIEPNLTRCVVNIVVKAFFGTELAAEEADQLVCSIRNILDTVWLGIMAEKSPSGVPIIEQSQYEQEINFVHKMVSKMIERRLQRPYADDDLMTALWQMVNSSGDKMTTDQLHDEGISTLVAGYESVAVAVCFALDLLTKNPSAMQKLQTEIDTVLGNRKPTAIDLPALSYARMVYQETLRLYAPSYWIQRMAGNNDEIDGFSIPAGSITAVMLHLIHHNPQVWPNPDQFEPERFTPERIAARHKLAWVPFGAGQRMCVGIEFALMLGQLTLVQTLQRFRVKAISERKLNILIGTNTRPQDGVWVKLEKRV